MDRQHQLLEVCWLRLHFDLLQMLLCTLWREGDRQREEDNQIHRHRQTDRQTRSHQLLPVASNRLNMSINPLELSHSQSSSSSISNAQTCCCIGEQQSDTQRNHPVIVESNWQGCQSCQSPGASELHRFLLPPFFFEFKSFSFTDTILHTFLSRYLPLGGSQSIDTEQPIRPCTMCGSGVRV